jgi:anti-sigma regulatory factor (Ser/Thr protein kinase)
VSLAAYTLRVAADPSLSVTVRMFAAEAARSLGFAEGEVEDLRLLATELLGNAVDTGGASLELTLSAEDGRWCLRARGAGALDVGADHVVDRRDVLTGLARLDVFADGTLELRPADGP